MIAIVLVVIAFWSLFSNCVVIHSVINREMIRHYGETLLCLKLPLPFLMRGKMANGKVAK